MKKTFLNRATFSLLGSPFTVLKMIENIIQFVKEQQK